MSEIYVAAGIARRDDGVIIAADAERCKSAEAAIERAESLSRSQGYLGAWAFTVLGDQTYGFAVAGVLRRFGAFPNYRAA